MDVGREWVAEEVSGCRLADRRLGDRLHNLMGSLGAQVGSIIPTACEDWASIKAAYRFLSNDRVDEHAILSGYMEATARRIRAADGPILILHDTTEFSYHRDSPEAIGYLDDVPSGHKDAKGRQSRYRVCGFLMHSSLAITQHGLPLGLCAVKFWSRKQVSDQPSTRFSASRRQNRCPLDSGGHLFWRLSGKTMDIRSAAMWRRPAMLRPARPALPPAPTGAAAAHRSDSWAASAAASEHRSGMPADRAR